MVQPKEQNISFVGFSGLFFGFFPWVAGWVYIITRVYDALT